MRKNKYRNAFFNEFHIVSFFPFIVFDVVLRNYGTDSKTIKMGSYYTYKGKTEFDCISCSDKIPAGMAYLQLLRCQ